MITKPSENLEGDHRFKKWGKLITSPADIDLSAKGGYALKGRWIKWEESISLQEGDYLICAAETGSIKNHSYDYALVGHNGRIFLSENFICSSLGGLKLEAISAAAQNSWIYAAAVYAALQYARALESLMSFLTASAVSSSSTTGRGLHPVEEVAVMRS